MAGLIEGLEGAQLVGGWERREGIGWEKNEQAGGGEDLEGMGLGLR